MATQETENILRQRYREMGWRNRVLVRAYFLLARILPDRLVLAMVGRIADRGGEESRTLAAQRIGRGQPERPTGTVVWLHAIGPGDATAILAMTDALLEADPKLSCVVTTRTVSARSMLQGKAADPQRVTVMLAPHDTWRAMVRFLDHWKPSLAIYGEGDFWPSALVLLKQRNVAVAIVNASFKGRLGTELRRVPAIGRWLMAHVDYVHLYDAADLESANDWCWETTKVTHFPDLKMASAPLPDNPEIRAALAAVWKDSPVLTLGSVAANEVSFLLDLYATAKRDIPALKLILAPRWIHIAEAMGMACEEKGLPYCLRSKQSLPDRHTDILIADTYGEMGIWYRSGFVAYVGASLDNGPGHNPFEPIAVGTPVIAASYTQHFTAVYTYLESIGVCFISSDRDDLARRIVAICNNSVAPATLPFSENLRQISVVPLASDMLRLVNGAPQLTR